MSSAGHVSSWYAASAHEAPELPPLCGSARADVCVVGGGYTGLSTALHLAERGADVVLLEAERIGWGASGRNGGHVGTGQRRAQSELEQRLGTGHARVLWDLGLEAVALVRALIERHRIDCETGSGILHTAWKASDDEALRREAAHLQQRYGYTACRHVERAETARLCGSEVFRGGLLDAGSLHLHPLNYALGLAAAARGAGARLYEHSRVTGYRRGRGVHVRTAQGSVQADRLVLACNGYLGHLEPRIAGLIMPINNFMIATEPLDEATADAIDPQRLAIQDSRFVIDYWRLSADRRLLFGGGENYRSGFPPDIASLVRRRMLGIYPALADRRIDHAWGGTLAITLGRLPAFGRLAPEILYALGYSGHGVPTATLAGKLLAGAITAEAAGFDAFAKIPQRRFPGGTLLRYPGMVLGLLYYALRDRL